MEQFYQDNRKYNGATAGPRPVPLPAATVGITSTSRSPALPLILVHPLSDQRYTITARERYRGDQNMTGFTLTITEGNVRRPRLCPPLDAAYHQLLISRKSGSC